MSQPAAVTSNKFVQDRLESSVTAAGLLLAGRTLISAIFLISGVGKLAAPAMTIGYIQSVGFPFATVGFALAVLIELGGGIALIAGYRTRIAAGIITVFCLATAVAFHANFADHNQLSHFLKNIAMAGGLLQIVVFGAGPFSLDARRNDHAAGK